MIRRPPRSTRTYTLLPFATLFRSVDGVRLHDDVEGLAILPRGRAGGLLFAASQDDDSFAVFRLPDGAYAGGFRIRGGAIDGTEDTDGIALHRSAARRVGKECVSTCRSRVST